MKLNLHNFLTLDGVMQAPGDADEDRTGGFGYGGWLVPFADQDMGMIVNGWFDKADAILLGPTTYEAIFHVVRPAGYERDLAAAGGSTGGRTSPRSASGGG
jgi:hypothetical protein